MRIRRAIIIPAILALSAAGSILTGTAASATAAQASSVHVMAAGASTHYWALQTVTSSLLPGVKLAESCAICDNAFC